MATATEKKKGATNHKGSVVFIHGMWGNGDQWADWEAQFGAAGYQTLAPTLPYHDVDPTGEPPAALGDVSLLDYADFLEQQIAALPDTPIIVGHSMGGIIAQILLARGVGSAGILLTPAPPSGAPATWELLMPSVSRTLLGKLFSAAIPKKPHRLSFRQASYACLNGLSPERQREEYAKWVWESGRGLWELGFWYLDKRKATKVDADAVTKVPTLTIAAGRDRIVPERVVRSVAKRYRANGDYTVFQSHAHMLIIEDAWKEVADHCADWIAEKAAATAPASATAAQELA